MERKNKTGIKKGKPCQHRGPIHPRPGPTTIRPHGMHASPPGGPARATSATLICAPAAPCAARFLGAWRPYRSSVCHVGPRWQSFLPQRIIPTDAIPPASVVANSGFLSHGFCWLRSRAPSWWSGGDLRTLVNNRAIAWNKIAVAADSSPMPLPRHSSTKSGGRNNFPPLRNPLSSALGYKSGTPRSPISHQTPWSPHHGSTRGTERWERYRRGGFEAYGDVE
jgi:hypothetical protein